jgi:hypothetical protein
MTPPREKEPDPGAYHHRVRPFLRAPDATPPPAGTTGASDRGAGPVPEAPEPVRPGLRPFVLTAGRVSAPDPAIGLETQVTARPAGGGQEPLARLSPELRGIVALCDTPISVAEIAARLRLHLGVTKILVSDLRAAGHLDVHTSDGEDPLDPDIILRVIDGLRAIS